MSQARRFHAVFMVRDFTRPVAKSHARRGMLGGNFFRARTVSGGGISSSFERLYTEGLAMKYVIGGGAVLLFCLALATTGDAGGKKKKGDSGDMLPPRADEVPKYMKMLTATNAKDRTVAAEKLGLRGLVSFQDVVDAIDPLKTALEKDTEPAVRKAAARALGNIQADPKETVPLLVKTVKTDKVMDVRLAATVALGQYGPDAKEALPTLREFAGEFNNKKAPEMQTIQAAIKMISGVMKKKN
jgi:hypothetical protein